MWETIRGQSEAASASSPVLRTYMGRAIERHDTLADAVAALLAERFSDGDLPRGELEEELAPPLRDCADALARDLEAVVASDPAAPDLLSVLLHFKGFHAVAAHRAAHAFWTGDPGRRQLALLLQGRASAATGVDIHPAASIGAGLFLDHATGTVIGEQASLGSDCYVLHGVTLGATGKVRGGRRHPAVGDRCVIGSGASVLGPIEVGDGATIGANACVTKNVEAGASVIETSFMSNRVLAPKKAKAQSS